MAGNRKTYLLLALSAVVVLGYAVFANFIHDPEAERFLSHKLELKRPLNLDAWLPVMRIHVVFACLSMIAGFINFLPAVHKNYRKLHRVNGYLYVVSVMLISLTSGYMAPYATGGKAVSIPFNMLNVIWPAFTILAIIAIKKKRVNAHRDWMTRSYAFVFTNFLIHLLTKLLQEAGGLSYTTSYTAAVYSTIILLLLAAELLVRWRRAR
ncbi:DUF2306 domain-containing protein [Paenibacillus xylaniclasticus]|uniref:DUF2306 domain-containing protein n=1 Tax=Paenibacillus xylaniclasticus TaxID=588083 RepID=UPI000FDB7EB1|nr:MULTISPECIES: DUF2306 domain-containing protein [Paenibacillus]GFN32908.1 hypothetical protein PCURB6_31680 [Paenibacillus curdlanolyticus]